MANGKKLLFTLEIDGSETAIKNATQLRAAISQINSTLKETPSGESYGALEQKMLKLKAELKEVEAEHRKTIRSFQVAKTGQDSYAQMNERLVRLRDEFKRLSKAERDSNIGKDLVKNIQALDAELKDIDASIGQFQRNIGNYASASEGLVGRLTGGGIDFEALKTGYSGLSDSIKGIGSAGSAAGKALASAFVVLTAVNLIFDGIQALKEYGAEFLALRTNVNKATGDIGEALDQNVAKVKGISTTFGAETEEIIQAANAVSKNFKTDFSTALDIISDGFLAGANNNGKYLDALTEMAPKSAAAGASAEQLGIALTQAGKAGLQEEEAIEKVAIQAVKFEGNLKGLIDTGSKYVDQQREQLSANEHLAAAQNAVSQSFDGLTATTGHFLKEAGAKSLDFLSKIIEGWSAWPIILRAAGAYFSKFVENSKLQLERLGVNFEILRLKASRIFTFDSDKLDNINAQISDLISSRQALDNQYKTSISASSAYFNELNKGLSERDDAISEKQKKQQAELNQAAKLAQEQTRKEIADRLKSEAEKNAREAEARRKAQEAALSEIEKYNAEKLALLVELSKRLTEQTVANIKDERARELAAEKLRFDEAKAALQKEGEDLAKAQKEARKKVVEVFKEGSKQVVDFDQKSAADRLDFQQKAVEIEAALLVGHRENLLEIDRRFDKIDNDRTNEAAKRALDNFKIRLAKQEQFADLDFRRQIDAVLSSDLGAGEKKKIVFDLTVRANTADFQAEKAKLLASLGEVEAELERINSGDVEAVSVEHYEVLISKQDATYQALADLEHTRTENLRNESAERQRINAEETTKALEGAQQFVNAAATLAEILSTREIAEIDNRVEAKQAEVDALKKQLDTADAKQKKSLEKRIKQEKDALDKIVTEKEEAEHKAAKTAKAFSIINSIINTALAVTKALASIGVGAAIAVGIQGAIQTALIAAQPVATGGVIGQGPVIPVQLSGQRVTHPANIPRQRNGDNVLAMLTRGEVVLNARQQRQLGGSRAFAAIGVPGFAEGGSVLGRSFSAPDVSGASRGFEKNIESLVLRLEQSIEATNRRIDRIRVLVVAEDVRADLAEGDSITAKTTLG